MKKVTIIIPVYNCEKYLEECLLSIEKQSFGLDNIEIIIVNDGSTDNSLNIINKYTSKYKDWTCITQENKGLAYSRNIAIKKATTDYVVFLDSDDYLDYNAIEILYNTITIKDVDVVVAKIKAFNSKRTFKYYTDKILYNDKYAGYDKNKKLLELISVASKIYRKSILDKYKFIDGVIHEDIFFSIKIVLDQKKFYLLNKELYYRRIREDNDKSIMQSLNYNTYVDLLKNYIKILEECKYDFHFSKYLVVKVNKYIARNVEIRDIKNAINDCKKLLDRIDGVNSLEKKYLIFLNKILNIFVYWYIRIIRRK